MHYIEQVIIKLFHNGWIKTRLEALCIEQEEEATIVAWIQEGWRFRFCS